MYGIHDTADLVVGASEYGRDMYTSALENVSSNIMSYEKPFSA